MVCKRPPSELKANKLKLEAKNFSFTVQCLNRSPVCTEESNLVILILFIDLGLALNGSTHGWPLRDKAVAWRLLSYPQATFLLPEVMVPLQAARRTNTSEGLFKKIKLLHAQSPVPWSDSILTPPKWMSLGWSRSPKDSASRKGLI